jgi:hypothetical protein
MDNIMINWRSIAEVGTPKDPHKTYLVTDGKELGVSGISGSTLFKGDGKPIFTFREWTGDENTWEDNSCCSGPIVFDLHPTHWCPTDEINLP